MTMITKLLAGAAGAAALATAAPAAAQYNPYGQGYNPYTYNQYNQYNQYNNRAYMTQIAAQQCTAAVQNRLHTRTGLTGIIGALLGAQATTGRVLGITQVTPRRSTIRVRGLASSGRAAYSPYGAGYYGSVGYAYQPDLQFRCDVDYRGHVRDIDIDRR